MRVERLPFTVYDIIGYFFPGFMLTWTFITASPGHAGATAWDVLAQIFNPSATNSSININIGVGAMSSVLGVFVFALASYVVGHLLAFISAMTIERLKTAFVGYPSRYLIDDYKFRNPWCETVIASNMRANVAKMSLLPITFLFMPYFALIFLVSLTLIFEKLLKRMPDRCLEILEEKLQERSGFSLRGAKNDGEWFYFIEHYVYNNYHYSSQRMYNYVVIYGFMRNTSLAFYLMSIIYFFEFKIGGECLIAVSFGRAPQIQVGLIFLGAALLLFGGFIKFMRRYSEEAVMAFVTVEERLLESGKKDGG